jgi:hypothetical protein
MTGDGKRCKMSVGKVAGHETFRQALVGSGLCGRQISGFGVRVPGGAPASRPRQTSQSVPGPLYFLRGDVPHAGRPPGLQAPASPADEWDLILRRFGCAD